MGAIRYRVNVLDALRAKGITTYTLRDGSIIGGATMQKIRRGEIVNAANLAKLCDLLQCQPGDLLEYVPDDGQQDGQPDGAADQCDA